MPCDTFNSSLFFHAGVWAEAPFERVDGFPSWCWAGWRTVTESDIVSPCATGFSGDRGDDNLARKDYSISWIRKEVAWFRVSDDQRAWTQIESAFIEDEGSMLFEQSLTRWHSADRQDLLEDVRLRFGKEGIPLTHALSCWSQSVYLTVDRTYFKDPNIEQDETGRRNLFSENPAGDAGLLQSRTKDIVKSHLSESFTQEGYRCAMSRSAYGFAVHDKTGKIVCYLNLTEQYRATYQMNCNSF
jgi:hypothetical protein